MSQAISKSHGLCSVLLSLTILLFSAPPAHAAIVAYIEGDVQGPIQGDVTLQGFIDWICFEELSHGIIVPTGQDGLPTGSPITTPVSVGKPLDPATIPLFAAATTTEILPIVQFDLVQSIGGGMIETYYRIELESARLVHASQATSDPDVSPLEHYEFVYSKITLHDLVNQTTATYNWNGAVGSSAGSPAGLPKLEAPAPNPSSGETRFRFTLPAANDATLSVFDLRGRRVRELHHGWTSPEETVAVWDGTDRSGARVAQGVYLVQLKYPGAILTQRVVMLR